MNFLDGSNILPKDGEALLHGDFFGRGESDGYFEALRDQIAWDQEPIVIFGREVMQPRLTAWYGGAGIGYSYSGLSMKPHPWTAPLLEIKRRVEESAGVIFTSALLNQYRDGNDSVDWHRDNERELGRNPTIASVSFGATRAFQMRHYVDRKLKLSVDLTHGSLLLMRGEMQHRWQHAIPKRSQVRAARINVTFRILGPNV